ncbi:DUF2865 domain-containing protein [Rhizobium sp. 32-5/1]|uniref:DUF2865 domain-containing protein n=1 Tax=Rhizobium sp. 32-5/1 TaxID=3019602 RepID=UPI00240E88F1|nr:DUF2865 domain-containing protein [Rhizobium sp. 32-5/1]WEZ84883.1 DUF2865 domain-containing protein [Rhizobium sp. 32-5/1]
MITHAPQLWIASARPVRTVTALSCKTVSGRIMQALARVACSTLKLPLMVAVAVISLVSPTMAQPGGCSMTPVASSTAKGAEAARLRRQIAANEAFSVKHGCASGKSSLACREIFSRISGASRRLAQISVAPAAQARCARPVGRQNMLEAFLVPRREKQPEQRRDVKDDTNALNRKAPIQAARMETMCVRLSDGYFFPSPNSGYGNSRDTDKIAVQCKFICDDAEMDVYRMTGADRNADDMVSLTTGKRYAELANAGAYRVAVPARTCDMARYYKTALARSPSAVAVDLGVSASDSAVPVPLLAMNMSLMSDVGLRGSRSLVTDRPRKVRIVGPAYLPLEE